MTSEMQVQRSKLEHAVYEAMTAAAGADGDWEEVDAFVVKLAEQGFVVTPTYVLEFVGWRSPTTGNLLRPGPNDKYDWVGKGYERVYVLHEERCFCLYDSRTMERTPNGHCPRHGRD